MVELFSTPTWIVISLVFLVFYYLILRKLNKLQKEKKMTIPIGILGMFFALITGIVLGATISSVFITETPDGFTYESTCKEYIIEHSDEITFSDYQFPYRDADNYKIDTCTLKYWDGITISDYGDSANILFWGDRDSWMWRFRLDKSFWVYHPSIAIEHILPGGSLDTLNGILYKILDELRQPKFPQPTGWVNDFENILDTISTMVLTENIVDYEKETTVEIVVVTLAEYDTLNFDNFFDYSTALANDWGVGKEGKDNGVLISISSNLREITIQVGVGLDDKLTDDECREIILRVVPKFEKGKYGSALLDMYGGIRYMIEN